jgi:hypothetical protein
MSGAATWGTLTAGGESAAGTAARAIGKRLAGRAILAPLGPIGWGIGAALLLYDAYELYNIYNESHKETEDKPAEESCEGCGKDEENAGDIKKLSKKELEKAAQNNGYDDAHALKDDFGLDSKSDIAVDKKGNLYSTSRKKGERGFEPLGLNKDGNYGN